MLRLYSVVGTVRLVSLPNVPPKVAGRYGESLQLKSGLKQGAHEECRSRGVERRDARLVRCLALKNIAY